MAEKDTYKIFINACQEGNELVVYQLYEEVRKKDIRYIAKSFEGALYYKQINVMKLLACLVYQSDLVVNTTNYFDMMYLLSARIDNLYWFCNENINEQFIRLIFDFLPRASSWFCCQFDYYKFAQRCIKTNFNLFRYMYEFDGEYRAMFCYVCRSSGKLIVDDNCTEAFQYFLTKEKENVYIRSSFDSNALYFKEQTTRPPLRKKGITNWFKLTVAYVLCKKNLHLYVIDLLEVFDV